MRFFFLKKVEKLFQHLLFIHPSEDSCVFAVVKTKLNKKI